MMFVYNCTNMHFLCEWLAATKGKYPVATQAKTFQAGDGLTEKHIMTLVHASKFHSYLLKMKNKTSNKHSRL